KPRRITLDDLTSEVAPKDEDSEMRSIVVRRGSASKEYSVPIEGAEKIAVNSGKPRRNKQQERPRLGNLGKQGGDHENRRQEEWDIWICRHSGPAALAFAGRGHAVSGGGLPPGGPRSAGGAHNRDRGRHARRLGDRRHRQVRGRAHRSELRRADRR